MAGKRPTPDMIQEPDVRQLVDKFDLIDEMFARRDGGNKGTGAAAADEKAKAQAK